MLTQSDLIFNQELAAWVQAVGSVFAIFVAISIPLYLRYLDKKQTKTQQDQQKQKYFVTLLPSFYRMQRYSGVFFKQIQQHPENSKNILHTLETEYLELIPIFAKELHIFVHSQIYDVKLNQLAFELFHSEEILQQHLLQPHNQKLITHQDQLLQYSQNIHTISSELIQFIESSYS